MIFNTNVQIVEYSSSATAQIDLNWLKGLHTCMHANTRTCYLVPDVFSQIWTVNSCCTVYETGMVCIQFTTTPSPTRCTPSHPQCCNTVMLSDNAKIPAIKEWCKSQKIIQNWPQDCIDQRSRYMRQIILWYSASSPVIISSLNYSNLGFQPSVGDHLLNWRWNRFQSPLLQFYLLHLSRRIVCHLQCVCLVQVIAHACVLILCVRVSLMCIVEVLIVN